MDQPDFDFEAAYQSAAAGSQRLAAAIDCLLPALIEIARAAHASVKDLNSVAESALIAFEETRGQPLDRRRYIASRAAAQAVAEGAALHASRHS